MNANAFGRQVWQFSATSAMAPRATTKQGTPTALIADAISTLQKAVGNAVSLYPLQVSLINLSRSVQLATTEEQAKTELARVNTELVEARRERDEAVKKLGNSKVQFKEWERQGDFWNSSVCLHTSSYRPKDVSPSVLDGEVRNDGTCISMDSIRTLMLQLLQIKHQAETIAQLKEETQQWKNQLLRFEEASRGEIQDWKEQYLRAEQERVRLSARLDELVAEQLEVGFLYSSRPSLT
jgi:hypothetical protein